MRTGHFKCISETLLPVIQNLPSSIIVDIRLFATGAAQNESSLFDNPVEYLKTFVSIIDGRPDVQRIIKEEMATATGDVSVNGMPLFRR